MAWYNTFIEYLMLRVQHKNFTKGIAKKWVSVFMHAILDMLACNGWVLIQDIGRIVLKKQKDYVYFNSKLNKHVTVRPKPRVVIKLHKPAIEYLERKLQEYGLTIEQVAFYSKKMGKKNVPFNVLKWFAKHPQKQPQINLDKGVK